MPEGAVYVGRPTKWGNPFAVGQQLEFPYDHVHGPVVRDQAHAVEVFRAYATITVWVQTLLPQLRGRDLACWCPLDQPCHADVLLELANQENRDA